MSLCEKCAADCRYERLTNEIVVHCGSYKPAMTNADRIRAMSDEELVSILMGVPDYPCDVKIPDGECDEKCEKCILDWLRKPVEEG